MEIPHAATTQHEGTVRLLGDDGHTPRTFFFLGPRSQVPVSIQKGSEGGWKNAVNGAPTAGRPGRRRGEKKP